MNNSKGKQTAPRLVFEIDVEQGCSQVPDRLAQQPAKVLQAELNRGIAEKSRRVGSALIREGN